LKKALHILNLSVENHNEVQRSLLAAYCNCLNVDEAAQVLSHTSNESALARRYLLRKINDDMSSEFLECHKLMINRLMKDFQELAWKRRVRVCRYLKSLSGSVPESERYAIVSLLLQSTCKTIRANGYKIIRQMDKWPCRQLVDCWEQFSDSDCVGCLLKFAEEEWLIKERFTLIPLLEPYQLQKLYIKICGDTPELLDELKEINAISYVYVLVKLNLPLDESEALRIFEANYESNNSGLFIWCLGQKCMWNALKSIEKRLSKIDLMKVRFNKGRDNDDESIECLNKLKNFSF